MALLGNMQRGGGNLVAALLITFFTLISISSVRHKSNTFDEIGFITSGFSYWAYNDYHLGPENGNLSQRLAALLPVLSNYSFPSPDDPRWSTANVGDMAHAFFYEMGNDADGILIRARLASITLGVLLAVLVFVWSRNLYGPVGGIVSLALFCLSPTVIANTGLATADIAISALMLAFLAAFGQLLSSFRLRWNVLSSLALGLILVTKYSAVLMLPVAALLIFMRLVRAIRYPTVESAAVSPWPTRFALLTSFVLSHLVAVLGIIWLCYGLTFSDPNPAIPRNASYEFAWEELATGPDALRDIVELTRRYELLPESFIYGFVFTYKHSQARNAFLGSNFSYTGWWYFFPATILLKTPLAWLAIVGLSLTATMTRVSREQQRSPLRGLRWTILWAYKTSPLWIFVLVYGFAAINSNLNIGHRHLLPIYAPVCILAGAAAWYLRPSSHRISRGTILVLFASLMVNCLAIWPHYLSFFNVLAGGPSGGYRYLVDSSLDWGQDLPSLKAWRDVEHVHSAKPLYLAYFGTSSPEYYGIRARKLAPDDEFPWALEPGVYAISATRLQGVYDGTAGAWTRVDEIVYRHLLSESQRREPEVESARANELGRLRFKRLTAYLRAREPDASAGYSILIYNLSQDDIREALQGQPPEPVQPPLLLAARALKGALE